jgi:hypothetical protein
MHHCKAEWTVVLYSYKEEIWAKMCAAKTVKQRMCTQEWFESLLSAMLCLQSEG